MSYVIIWRSSSHASAMKLVTYLEKTRPTLGFLHGEAIVPLSAIAPDMLTLIAAGPKADSPVEHECLSFRQFAVTHDQSS